MGPKSPTDVSPSRSPQHSPQHSTSSAHYNPHAPANPSQLREVHILSSSERSSSPEDTMHPVPHQHERDDLDFSTDGINPGADRASVHSIHDFAEEPRGGRIDVDEPTVRTRLLNHKNWDAASGCGDESCAHGTLSPRPPSGMSYGSFNTDPPDTAHALLGDAFVDGVLGGRGNKSTTQALAERNRVKNKRMM